VNATDNHGETALMLSAFMGHHQIVNALLSGGASTLQSTPYGWTALTFAEDCGEVEVADTLRRACKSDEDVAPEVVYGAAGAVELVA